MKLPFSKYHGTGNDFILVDNREGKIHLTRDQVILLCDRHFGIGSDGLMTLNAQPGYDFGMSYFNSDGNESTMCGNGGRCLTAFAKACGLINTQARFLAIDGEHIADILQEKGTVTQVKLKMSDVTSSQISSPTSQVSQLTSHVSQLTSHVPRLTSHVINTGSPHFVLFVEDAFATDVVNEGRKIRNDREFAPEGINVDFVQIRENGDLYVRTYERGVEDETLSCGTGVTAAALAYASGQAEAQHAAPGSGQVEARHAASGSGPAATSIRVETRGGILTVSFRREPDRFTDIWLEGPAKLVFSGVAEV